MLWQMGLLVILLFFAYLYFLIFCNKTWITYTVSECLYNKKNKHPKTILRAIKSCKSWWQMICFLSSVAIWRLKSKTSPSFCSLHLELDESQILCHVSDECLDNSSKLMKVFLWFIGNRSNLVAKQEPDHGCSVEFYLKY